MKKKYKNCQSYYKYLLHKKYKVVSTFLENNTYPTKISIKWCSLILQSE